MLWGCTGKLHIQRRGITVVCALAVLLGACGKELPPAPRALGDLRDGVTPAESLAILSQGDTTTASPNAAPTSTQATETCTTTWSAPDTVTGCRAPVPTVDPLTPWLVHDGQARDSGEIEQRASIKIGFGGPIKGLTLTSSGALKCSGAIGGMIGFRGGVQVALAPNALSDSTDCGADDVTFGVTGQFPPDTVIDSLVIVGVDPWTFQVSGLPGRALLRYTLTYQPTVERCEVPVTPYSQGEAPWGTLVYDSSKSGTTIGVKGCALTALAMSLTWAGYPVHPDSLNAFMNSHHGFRHGAVNWLWTVPAYTAHALQWHDLVRKGDKHQLAASVCSGAPVVVYVPSLETRDSAGNPGPHFVLVTGAPRDANDSTPLDEFTIVDPDNFKHMTLAPFGSFVLRGYPAAPGATQPPPVNAPGISVAMAEFGQARWLQFSAVGGTLIVADPQGRRLGQESADGPVISEIPGGYFNQNDQPDDAGSPVLTGPQVASASVQTPVEGQYQVVVTASASISDASIEVDADLTTDSLVMSKFRFAASKGQVYHFVVTYDASSNGAPLLQPAVPVWAPNTAYAVGDSASYNHLDYVCRQAHTSQVGWEPPNVYALWARVAAGDTWATQVLYAVGDTVLYQGVRYTAIQAHQSQPGWEPPNEPALWARVP